MLPMRLEKETYICVDFTVAMLFVLQKCKMVKFLVSDKALFNQAVVI